MVRSIVLVLFAVLLQVATCQDLVTSSCSVARNYERTEALAFQAIESIRANGSSLFHRTSMLKDELFFRKTNYERWLRKLIDKEHIRMGSLQREIGLMLANATVNDEKISKYKRSRDRNKQLIGDLYKRLIKLEANCRDKRSSGAPTNDEVSCVKKITGRDCAEVYSNGGTRNGVYFIKPRDRLFPVYCQQESSGGGWTYIHSHVSNELEFNRDWLAYKHGFGNLSCATEENFWVGNEAIHELTSDTRQKLRVEVEDWSNNGGYAIYDTFIVHSESTNYTLEVGGYRAPPTDEIGDAFKGVNFGHADDVIFTNHNGMQFTTFDRDHDNYIDNCAAQGGGAWWYNRCSAVNLNGVIYDQGFYTAKDTIDGFDNAMIWGPWTGLWYSLKKSKMMVRPLDFAP